MARCGTCEQELDEDGFCINPSCPNHARGLLIRQWEEDEEMIQTDLDNVRRMAAMAREDIWLAAKSLAREPKIYLHWTAGRYNQKFDDYHINIDGEGNIFVSTTDFSEVLAHTWLRNTGSIGITLDCAYGATSQDLGDYPPTARQIEVMAQVTAAVADALWLTIDLPHVMTHGEAADNLDGLETHEPYGPATTVERWDLQYLGTAESPRYTANYDSPRTGGNVLRGKANYYRNKWREGK